MVQVPSIPLRQRNAGIELMTDINSFPSACWKMRDILRVLLLGVIVFLVFKTFKINISSITDSNITLIVSTLHGKD